MANVRKRISELTALNSASLDTVIVGVDNGTTYKIELDVLADAVSNRVNTLDRERLQSLESVTSSFEIKGRSVVSGSSQLTSSFDIRYVVSGSITQTNWDNIANKPAGIVSQSTDLTPLNNFTASISTASLVTSIDNLNTFTASQSTSSLVDRLNTIESVSGSWITESVTGSFLTSLSGAISSSSQLTSSYDTRYTLSGSILSSFSQSVDSRLDILENEISSSVSYAYITYITEPEVPNDDANRFLKPDGNVSGSISYNQSTGYFTLLAGKTYKLRAVVNMSGGSNSGFEPLWNLQWKDTTNNVYIGVQSKFRVNVPNEAYAIITPNTNIQVGLSSLANTENSHPYIIKNSTFFFIEEMALGIVEGITGSTDFIQITNKPTLISGSSQLTSSYDTRYTLSGSVQPLPSNLVSSSAQITAFGFISSSTTIPAGTISGSSQLTSSFDSRYVLESETGSLQTSITNLNTFTASQSTASLVTSISNLNSFTQSFSTSVDSRFDTLEATIISGSPNYTQVLGNRRTSVQTVGVNIISGSITTTGNPVQIMVTGDANPVNVTSWTRLQIFRDENAIGGIVQVENSSNLNVPYCVNVIDTPSAGTYSYSMRTVSGISGLFDFGESTGPVLTAVELRTNIKTSNFATTGSNSFNGNQTITGSVTTTGVLNVGTIGSGDEGGEIQLVVPQTNTSLTNKVIVDVFRNTLRFWEGGPNSKGVHIDLTKAPDGVAGELIWKASGMVGAGTFVTLDNLKCTITTSGNRGLSIGAVSTNFEADVSGVWMTAGGSVGASANNISYTTAASTSLFDVNFVAHGNTAQYQIRDKTNNRFYRVTMMIGISYISNFISIERLF